MMQSLVNDYAGVRSILAGAAYSAVHIRPNANVSTDVPGNVETLEESGGSTLVRMRKSCNAKSFLRAYHGSPRVIESGYVACYCTRTWRETIGQRCPLPL